MHDIFALTDQALAYILDSALKFDMLEFVCAVSCSPGVLYASNFARGMTWLHCFEWDLADAPCRFAWMCWIALPYDPFTPFLTDEYILKIRIFPVELTPVLLNKVKECVIEFLFDRPLADSDKLPVRSHRAAEAPKSPVEDGDAASQEPKKKSSKEKREKKKDKDRDRKVRLFSFLLHTCLVLLSW